VATPIVVFVSLDTTRADHFGFLGNGRIRTPRLDALARESIVFDDYMTVTPTTLASHTSLFTGMYPHHHGTPRNGFRVNADNDMLAERLARAGFTAAGFAGSFALSDRFDFAQGFAHWDERFDVHADGEAVGLDQRSATAVTDAVIDWLDQAPLPERLFLFAHYFDPHAPYAAPPPFDTLYDPRGGSGLPTSRTWANSADISGAEERRTARRLSLQYASEISYLDHEVGRLLDALRERGILDRALLVVTSDHGETFLERPPFFNHGYHVHGPSTRAVCLIRLPGAARAGTRVGSLVASVDVLPTVLAWLGLWSPEEVDGEALDLRSELDPAAPRTRFAEATKPWESAETDPRWVNLRKARAVREGRLKLVWTPHLGTEALYDVVADPAEQHDLLGGAPPELRAEAARLREKLVHWTDSAAPLPSEFVKGDWLDTVERLRALGYLEDESG
jgi:arylsulfatase A-like enzyme